MLFRILILNLLICLFIFNDIRAESNLEKKLSERILVNDYNWVYPNMSNPVESWKFLSDGTFNYSTIIFGGITRRGRWNDIGNNKVKLSYDFWGKGELEIVSDTIFKVGNRLYHRY